MFLCNYIHPNCLHYKLIYKTIYNRNRRAAHVMHILGSVDIFAALKPIIFTFCAATHRRLEGEKNARCWNYSSSLLDYDDHTVSPHLWQKQSFLGFECVKMTFKISIIRWNATKLKMLIVWIVKIKKSSRWSKSIIRISACVNCMCFSYCTVLLIRQEYKLISS